MFATRYQPPGKPTALGVHGLEARRRPDPGNLAMGGVRERAAGRGLKHRELYARRSGINDQNGLAHSHAVRADRAICRARVWCVVLAFARGLEH